MLILTRRVGDTIRINDDISVTVLAVSGRQVKLGVDTPAEVVYREEIYQGPHAEQQAKDAAA